MKINKFVLIATLIFAISNPLKSNCQNLATNSVLSSGKWVKIGIEKDGIYCISYQKLKELGFSNPDQVRVYGNDFGMLPFYNNEDRPSELIENQIFKDNDKIFFYAKAADVWSYNEDESMYLPKNHLFTETSYYFLTDYNSGTDNGIKTSDNSQSITSQTITEGIFHYCHEEDLVNLQLSGRDWFGENFSYQTTQKFNFNCNEIPNSAKLKISLIARSSTTNTFSINVGNNSESTTCNAVSQSGLYADRKTKEFEYAPLSSENQEVTISFNKNSASAEGYLDYIVLNTKEPLKYDNKQLIFNDLNTNCEYRIENGNSNLYVFDITDSNSPTLLKSTVSDNYISFKSNGKSENEFVVFSESDAYDPLYLTDEQNIGNQNLHSLETPEYLIITPKCFEKYAKEIKSIHSDLKTEVVTNEQIFNEFSCGMPDVSALRDFVRYLYKKDNKLKYLLLFGDGSVDNKDISDNNTNLILTYQSPNSLNENNLSSFVTDDFFGFLDDDEGEYTGKLDIGIGRWPVKNEKEAQIAVDKIKNYQSNTYDNDWKKWICFVADDENSNLHNQQADYLAVETENNYPEYNICKIYTDNYKQISSATGNTYPEARKDIINTLNNGVQILDYTGHGGMNFFADERILTNTDIDELKNSTKLPLIITASCNIGHFDYYSKTTDKNTDSPAEHFLMNSKGGAIALLTTTREVLSNANFNLSKNIFKYLLEKNSNGSEMRFGDIIRLAKIETDDYNMLNFTLLGDPACKFNFPKYNVEITKINGKEIDKFNDTIKALGKYEVECKIANSNFNGTAFVTIFDKPKQITTLNNDGVGSFDYQDYTDKIFSGTSSVSNGIFTFQFIVPKDIDYNVDFGKVSLYAENEEVSATGYSKSLKIGSCDSSNRDDQIGPEIILYLNDYNFVDGSKVNKNPTLIVRLWDNSGINITNSHNIVLSIDDSNTTTSLSEFYKADMDSFTSGKVEYLLSELSEGKHTLKVKAWDNFDNSNESEINFYISSDYKLQISHLLNYPNPFTDKTKFFFEYNNPQSTINYELTIFTVSGSIVKVLTGTFTNNRTLSEPIEWDGKDDFGNSIARGIYFYRLKIKDLDNKKATAYEKLLYLK